jgi:hypothetical protein
MAISMVSAWLMGGLDGYAAKDGGLPSSMVAGTLTVSSTLSLLSISDNLSEYVNKRPLSVMLGTSIFFGSLFYMGYQLGSAIRILKDNDRDDDLDDLDDL